MITGRGRYVDDMVVPGCSTWPSCARQFAHAKITSIDTAAAKALPGIHGVFTGEDLDIAGAAADGVGARPASRSRPAEHWPLARGEVNYVGQGVAIVVGDDKYAVVDAAEQVIVEYEPLPVVVDPEKALEDGSPLVHEDLGTNQVHEWTIGGGDMDAALGRGRRRARAADRQPPHRGHADRAARVIADYRGGSLTLHLTSQNPHLIRLFMAGQFGLSEDHVRVIAPGRRRRLRREDHGLPGGDHRLAGRRASSGARSSGPRPARST